MVFIKPQFTKLQHIFAHTIFRHDLENKVSFRYQSWDQLPYHKQLSYLCEARKMIEVIKMVKSEFIIKEAELALKRANESLKKEFVP